LYLNPPAHAAVFSVDEKTAIQALDRKDPVLPLLSRTSSLLRGIPPLGVNSVRSPSWFRPLVAFPFASTPKVPTFRIAASLRINLYAGYRSARNQVPSELVPRISNDRGFDIV
jgi:hypothetical protein